MQYVRFGRTGLKVSRLCLGCMTYGTPKWRPWILDEEASRPFFRQALEAGINFFDTADMYSQGVSEEVTGRALKDLAKRDDVVIATKAYWPMGQGPNDRGLSRKHLMSAIDASLKRLATDYVDLYQIHRWDYETPVEETMQALDDIVRAGKARYVGASSMYAWQLMQANALAERNGWTRFVSMQPQLNLVYREEEREMLPLCREQGIAVIPWSPLARGFLAGNRKAKGEGDTARSKADSYADQLYFADEDFKVLAEVEKVAKARGVKPIQIALAWVLQVAGVTSPIVGFSKAGQVEDAIAALEIALTPEEIKALEAPYRPKPVLDHA
jgi:aryl-alcohol dehydrogenase (NADP+)